MKTPYITYIFSRNRSNDAGLVWSAEHVFGESLGRVNYGPNTPTVVVVVTPEELGQYRGVLSAETRYKGVGCVWLVFGVTLTNFLFLLSV